MVLSEIGPGGNGLSALRTDGRPGTRDVLCGQGPVRKPGRCF